MASTGHDIGLALAKVLGIDGKPWDRIVIVADVKDVARVYVRGFVTTDAVAGIAQAVKDVQVSADGDVSVTPLVVTV